MKSFKDRKTGRKMLSPAAAVSRLKQSLRVVGDAERVDLPRAAGRILAETLKYTAPLPPFSKAAMDGFAVRSGDFEDGLAELKCVGTILAGDDMPKPLKAGTCMAIMTGAPAPRNADAVIKIESARHLGEDVWRLEEPRIGPELYLAVKGSEARKGALLARAGQQIDARLCGTMAASGHAKPKVIRRLKVSSIVTGNEVVPLDATPGPAGIRDTNGTVLSALLSRHAWIEHARAEMVRDEERLMKRRLRAALGSSDCVLLSGGVSMGERDLVPEVLRDLGVRRVFHKLAMRPGKPIWFGVHGENTAVFGLPGHPVSVQVTFHEFALPGMRIMGGFSDWQPRATWLPAGVEFNRRVALRSYILCRVKRGERGVSALYPVKHRGSGDFASAVPSEGVAILPEGSWRPQEGEPVEYHAWDAQ